MKRFLQRQYVYDAVQRLLHWWLALATLLLMLTGFIASNQDADSRRAFMWAFHMQCGKWLLVGLVGRIVWGIIGPEHARFTAFFHPREWLWSVKNKRLLTADADFGHHAQASMSYLGFYGLIILMSVTGLCLAAIMHGEGPLADRLLDNFKYLRLLRNIHEYGWWLVAFFVVTHVAALVFHEWYDRIPLAQSMISGYQYRTDRKEPENVSKK